jgi:hypothetical protein
MKALRRFRTGDENLDRLQDALQEWARQLDRNPWLDGVLLEGVALAAGTNVITHKLGRALRGWWLVRRVRAGGAANYPSELASDEDTLTLDATGAETVSIWVW